MFYSHEILTDRKHGIATIWLVATLGSKSSAKKVTKKAILQVNIPKACDTVTHPQVPMALRLQSNLLVGISRVHLSQCGYVLADAESIQQEMRALLRAIRDNFLDPNAGVVKPQTLLLQDDPAFLPEMIPELDMDFGMLEMTSPFSSQYSSQRTPTNPSPLTSQATPGGGFDIIIPSDDSPGSPGRNPMVQEQEARLSLGLEDNEGLLDDAGFAFDADGNLIDTSQVSNAVHGSGGLAGTTGLSGGVGGALQSKPAQDPQLHANQNQNQDNIDIINDQDHLQQDQVDEQPGQEDVQMADQTNEEEQIANQLDEDVQGEVALAPARKARARRPLKIDDRQDLRSTELQSWQADYLANMKRAKKEKAAHRLHRTAKETAAAYVYGNGLGGLGLAGPMMQKLGPLSMFAGEALQEMVFGKKEPLTEPRGKKRTRSEEPPEDEDQRNVRRKSDDIEAPRGAEEDNILDIEEEEIEIGRGAAGTLDDMTAQMPWNLSSSQHGGSRPGSRAGSNRPDSRAGSNAIHSSAQRAQFMPFDAGANIPSSATIDLQDIRRTGRITSASPLKDRGLPSASTGYQASPMNNFAFDDAAADDFEFPSPGAGLDTRTAGEREWVERALRQEEQNFLDFIDTELGRSEQTEITFEQLVPPATNNHIVATQGFLHVLGLASRGLLEVKQDDGFAAPIRMQPTAGA